MKHKINPPPVNMEEEIDRLQISPLRKRIFKMVSVGVIDEPLNQMYDVISTLALIVNLAVTILNTYEYMRQRFGVFFDDIEAVTVAFFAIDYFFADLYGKMSVS